MAVIIIKIILAAIFTLSVAGKLTGKTKSTFEMAGYSPQAMYLIAIAEIILTIGLFTMFELVSTAGLLAIIGGAVFTLLGQRAKPSRFILALITTALLVALLVILISKSSWPF